MKRFRSFGLAYLRWAMKNPAHFEIISSGRYFDHGGAAALSRDNAELIALTGRLLADASAQGDGDFPRWGVAKGEVEAVIDLFIGGIGKR